MPLSGVSATSQLNMLQASAPMTQAQQVRAADAQLRAEAQRIQAQAFADGQTVTTQLTYSQGPDGRSYVSSITITRSGREPVEPSGNGAQDMRDIAPVRMPFTPSDMAEGFAVRMEDAANALAQSLATAELQSTDVNVRNHEGLHFRTAGGLATGLPQLEYVQGPDGQYYAVAGEVRVQTGATADPEKASRDAATFARAATAPGDMSAQDMLAARNAYAAATDTYGKALAGRGLQQAEYNLIA